MLGMFLLIQLSIVGGDWLRRSVLPALARMARRMQAAGTLILALSSCEMYLQGWTRNPFRQSLQPI